ncbi:MAG: hypothetical protein UR62_C0006G0008 [Candidatus Nomurabacteria bacterium GW2011_GWF2_35_12]|uniref:Uncharacterized protein n=3 Tax=Candidatus Nomuraibacteriota TaxID=1752729 RepID=A0A0G0E8V9_9BACT|nr:MAG: hypothetical protein UR62_C0006G0008 [Candidatus Nomurabacteria bacterium GW2011_GWF2_35_12]KKP72057.1 MAG: hypothetical protein UR70_C0014G0012 [Candidatus Nomurabacteria bacterium GW2011_GWB1_35_20]KKP76458.1 MAG: hypothetical protein UR72_C0002G0104 [Parcubacteria group bacterium GW2011_GWC1_35_21]KKP78155.1 MAG: hypothetical protein UR77_C0006G0027 [Candidatus Nomurabacteria bacterium GW2011_GWC2_35_35]KKP85463.1 MAG: hypothetical protein UR86_C0002G0003 [Parcubacteria group bacteri
MPSEKLSKNPIEKGQKKESILKMEDFYKEINILIAKRKKEEINGMYELLFIKNVEDLTETDAFMWRKVNSPEINSITQNDLEAYRQDVKNSNNISRKEFQALIVQKITILWLDRQTKERYSQGHK